eukprot:6804290-Pyramimonas_sp.AAC.1
MQGHLQDEYGPMYYWLTQFLWVLIRKPTEIMANHRFRFTLFERRRCAGHHQHASVCNREIFMAALYILKMQPRFVDVVQIAHDHVQ